MAVRDGHVAVGAVMEITVVMVRIMADNGRGAAVVSVHVMGYAAVVAITLPVVIVTYIIARIPVMRVVTRTRAPAPASVVPAAVAPLNVIHSRKRNSQRVTARFRTRRRRLEPEAESKIRVPLQSRLEKGIGVSNGCSAAVGNPQAELVCGRRVAAGRRAPTSGVIYPYVYVFLAVA